MCLSQFFELSSGFKIFREASRAIPSCQNVHLLPSSRAQGKHTFLELFLHILLDMGNFRGLQS